MRSSNDTQLMASELIRQLQSLIEHGGDQPVAIENTQYFNDDGVDYFFAEYAFSMPAQNMIVITVPEGSKS